MGLRAVLHRLISDLIIKVMDAGRLQTLTIVLSLLGALFYLDRKIDVLRRELSDRIDKLQDRIDRLQERLERLQKDVWMIKGFLFKGKALLEEEEEK